MKIAEVLQTKVGGKFAALCVLDGDVDTLADSLKEVRLSTVEEVLWRQMRRFNFGSQARFWICATEKRQLKRQKYTSTEARLEYRKVNREVERKMKAAKEEI